MTTEEFSEVLKSNGDMAFRMACRLTGGNEPLARDLVQDALLKVWKKWERRRQGSLKGWMYRILHNLYMDHLRRKIREAVVSCDAPSPAEGQSLLDALPESGPLPLEQLERDELQNAIRQALGQLPRDFRVPIMLCDMEGLPYEEIARIVSCPVGTVRSRIHRGRRQLRQTLVQLAPVAVAVATALGVWFLCRAQRQHSSIVHIETVARPMPPLAHLKGERREHQKS